ncbi:hypothetical protein Nepgr_028837 [Nepenthes gracilis]|uniref:Uncharacterized protein n=1 Tax=Nepenthes gracilis TaxID=150966 RepID=A0AAD3TD03_NEPGR|nr:hypothetical protein Nepgr_028837 [Nepenthes gracilis]
MSISKVEDRISRIGQNIFRGSGSIDGVERGATVIPSWKLYWDPFEGKVKSSLTEPYDGATDHHHHQDCFPTLLKF